MASPPTANEIKTQLLALLATPLGTGKKTKLLDYLPLAYLVAEGEDPTVLKSPTDTVTLAGGATTQRVNCLMVTELGFAQSPPQSDSDRHETRPRGQNSIARRFGLAYIYQFGAGSEAVFSTNVELARTTLNSNPKLGLATVTSHLAGQGAFVRNHAGLQASSMLPAMFSGILCHSAEMLLVVNLIEPLGGAN